MAIEFLLAIFKEIGTVTIFFGTFGATAKYESE